MNEDRWARIAEHGTAGALAFAAWVHRRFGRRVVLPLLWLVSCYFYARSATVRQASRGYLERLWASPEGRAVLGRKPGRLASLRHIQEFGVSIYDRMLVWGGALESFTADHDGTEHAFELARSGRGALLLGAHLGSIEMLWCIAREYELPVNVVAFHGNAQRINAFFESRSPEQQIRVIEIDPDSVRAAFEIRACIERGEFVAMLADRLAPGKTGRSVEMLFLGLPAHFPLGPFLLAGVLDCPVFFTVCLRSGDCRYQTVMRPIGDAGRPARRDREKRARELLARYTALLERYCQQQPYQWFNFYDFWEDEPGDAP